MSNSFIVLDPQKEDGRGAEKRLPIPGPQVQHSFSDYKVTC